MRAAAIVAAVVFGGMVVDAPGSGDTQTVPAGPEETTVNTRDWVNAWEWSEGRDPRAPLTLPGGVVASVSDDRDTRPTIPSSSAIRAAKDFASHRTGLVSYAFLDSGGRLRGHDPDRAYAAASVVKAMLLAAEIRRIGDASIDPATDELLTAMITRSDNEAADAIYARVGDSGLDQIARLVRMESFTVAGHWGNAQITAADIARLFGELGHVLAGPHRVYALGLLGTIAPEQSWGVPEVAGRAWAVRFKGGWLPDRALVHQAAELRERHGSRELSLAILTDSQSSFDYGIETVEGIAARLLSR